MSVPRLNLLNLPPGIVILYEIRFSFRKSGANKHKWFWRRFRFWSHQTGLGFYSTAEDYTTCLANICILMNDFLFPFWFNWILFLEAQLVIRLHLFQQWMTAEEAKSHYLNSCWASSLTHMCGSKGRWVNMHNHWCGDSCGCIKICLLSHACKVLCFFL